MKRIYIWLNTKWIKFKLHKARSFMEANCLERIKRGQVSRVGEDAAEDWCVIQNCISDTITASLSPKVSSSLDTEDIHPG